MAERGIDKMDQVLLLLYAADHTGRHGAPVHGITRLEKLIFLIEQEGGLSSQRERFEFEAYKFGPFSSDVYDLVEALSGWQLVEVGRRTLADYYEAAEVKRLDEKLSDRQDDSELGDDESVGDQELVQEKVISLTDRGIRLAAKLVDKVTAKEWGSITRIRQKYGGMSLRHLIAYVYQTYPKYAEKSELV